MKAQIKSENANYSIDLNAPIDISIPLHAGGNLSAWYVEPVRIEPVRTEHFLGSVKEGGTVNFKDIYFNPHGHGTHTECVGHISTEDHSINQNLKRFWYEAELVTIEPTVLENGDQIISREQLSEALKLENTQAIIIRTLPNGNDKLSKTYSNSNPPYIEVDAMDIILTRGIKHLLIDLPSIDKELDGGALAAHHRFWNYPESPAMDRTITEFIYVPNEVLDGIYLLNLQIASFENDASPSKPVLYKPL